MAQIKSFWTLLIVCPQSTSSEYGQVVHSVMPQPWMRALCLYGKDDSYCLQLHVKYGQQWAFYTYILKTGLKTVTAWFFSKRVLMINEWVIFFVLFFLNKLGFQPTIIAQACWSHRLNAFTQAAICIRLFAFVCSLPPLPQGSSNYLRVKGAPRNAGPGRPEQHVFTTATHWFTPARVGVRFRMWCEAVVVFKVVGM